jgi:dienelactone hydrolase
VREAVGSLTPPEIGREVHVVSATNAVDAADVFLKVMTKPPGSRSCRLATGFLATLLFLAAGAGAAEIAPPLVTGSSIQDRLALFDYDHGADLRVKEIDAEQRGGGVTVRDITFSADPGDPEKATRAFLVVPKNGGAPRAGVLWVHWLGRPATTNRTEFLDEAVALAPHGVVSLLVDAMWSAPKWYPSRVLEEDFANSIRQVIALRRAMDLLVGQPAVDRKRLGVVGHDYGAMYSAITAGVESRARAYVFIAATASLTDWAFFAKKPVSQENYLRQNRPLELTDYLREVRGGNFLMQFAERDRFVPLAKAQEFFAAVTNPKQMIVYGGAEHEMTEPAAIRIDRTAFLVRELGLK